MEEGDKSIAITGSIVLYKSNPLYIQSIINHFFEDKVECPERLLILVDNSPYPTLSYLSDRHQRVVYIHNPQNIGFGKAHNQAIRKAKELGSTYHVIINPDVLFEADTISKLSRFMDQTPDVSMVMPAVYFPDGKPQYLCKLLPRPQDVFVRRFLFFIPTLNERINRKYELRAVYRATDPIEVPCLSGCFLFARTQKLLEIGGFDDRYFMYVEDVDLSRRMAEVGRVVCLPTVTISHLFTRGSYRDSKLLKHHVKSMIKYFNKWGWFCDAKRKEINRACLARIEKY